MGLSFTTFYKTRVIIQYPIPLCQAVPIRRTFPGRSTSSIACKQRKGLVSGHAFEIGIIGLRRIEKKVKWWYSRINEYFCPLFKDGYAI